MIFRKGFITVTFLAIIAALIGVTIYFFSTTRIVRTTPSPKMCTQEAKQCPDGSYVGRVGPNCEFAKCPDAEKPPIGRVCIGPNDTSCPADYECVQGCGPPVVRYPDNTPPTYNCQLKGYVRPCPICLAKNTLIDTPQGAVPVQKSQKGMSVWTINKSGERVAGIILKTGSVKVPQNHLMVRLALSDGRTLLVSPGHPTVDGRTVGSLTANDLYNGARVVSANRVTYGGVATYDILPSGETGYYFANGIPLDSTLH